jgi:hypothetical protein
MPNTTIVAIGDNRKPVAFTIPVKPVMVTNLPIYINNPATSKSGGCFTCSAGHFRCHLCYPISLYWPHDPNQTAPANPSDFLINGQQKLTAVYANKQKVFDFEQFLHPTKH